MEEVVSLRKEITKWKTRRYKLRDLIQKIEELGLNQSDYENCLRDIKDKLAGVIDDDWQEIVERYGLPIHPDTLRKASQTIFGGAFVSEYMKEIGVTRQAPKDYIDQIRKERQESLKEKQKIRDERNDLQRSLREQARRESFIELVKRVMTDTAEPAEFNIAPKISSDNDMIICLSDIHAGISTSTFWNDYDMNEVWSRLEKYLVKIIGIQETHKCKEAYLVLGGDLISGIIHPNLRLQQNENVIGQLKTVSLYLKEFIKVLAMNFETVKVYSVSGNHSRLMPKKEEHLRGEELDALVPFYLEQMFRETEHVHFPKNYLDDTIVAFKTRGGKLVYAVHGHLDGNNSVARSLTMMTGTKPDLILIGHKHHNALTSDHNVKVVATGSVVGTDDYCVDHRISGRPEQCVVITNKKDTVKCLYDVGLDNKGD